jgi:hypothetical protein
MRSVGEPHSHVVRGQVGLRGNEPAGNCCHVDPHVERADGRPRPCGASRHTWKLVSKSPERGLVVVITDSHHRVVQRLAHGDLVVNEDEVAFFNAQICGLALPDGVGRYRWNVEGSRLHFTPIDEDPCGGRAAIFDDATYERVG